MGEPNNLQEVREDHKRVIGGEVNTAWGAGLGRTRVPARYRRVAVFCAPYNVTRSPKAGMEAGMEDAYDLLEEVAISLSFSPGALE